MGSEDPRWAKARSERRDGATRTVTPPRPFLTEATTKTQWTTLETASSPGTPNVRFVCRTLPDAPCFGPECRGLGMARTPHLGVAGADSALCCAQGPMERKVSRLCSTGACGGSPHCGAPDREVWAEFTWPFCFALRPLRAGLGQVPETLAGVWTLLCRAGENLAPACTRGWSACLPLTEREGLSSEPCSGTGVVIPRVASGLGRAPSRVLVCVSAGFKRGFWQEFREPGAGMRAQVLAPGWGRVLSSSPLLPGRGWGVPVPDACWGRSIGVCTGPSRRWTI